MSTDVRQKITHFNIPQQKGFIVDANTTVAILARAAGKDHGFVAPTLLRNVKGMPRGATAFAAPTYMKAKGDMIPALVKALEKFNFYEDIDFWVGKYIPKNIPHDRAFEHPRDPDYSTFFRNGHTMRIIGLDNKKTANGQSNDGIILNEGRFVKQEDFDSRLQPTNRGNEDIFSHLHYHHHVLITSDMPRASFAKWIMAYEKLMDPEQIDLIVSFDYELREKIKAKGSELLAQFPEISTKIKLDREALLAAMRDLVAKGKLHEALEKRFRIELKRLDDILFELRREAVYFIRGSTLDNIDVVGEKYINNLFRTLLPPEFNTSVLNLQGDGAEDPFYSTFNDELHCYDDIDYSYVEMFGDDELPQPWKADGDVDPTRPLHIACDFNKKITCMEVGQEFTHVFKILRSLHVKDPERIKHLAKLFAETYVGYPTRKVIHHFDSNATGEDASREISFATELKNELNALGWIVEEHYIGIAPTHRSRNKLFLRVYAEDDINTKPIRINRTNCAALVVALANCGSIEMPPPKMIQKDKRPEQQKTVPPEHAPHHTDAHDTMYIGVFQDRLGDDVAESDWVT